MFVTRVPTTVTTVTTVTTDTSVTIACIAQVQQQFETNVFGAWRVNHAALPHMRAQKSGLLLHMGPDRLSLCGAIGLELRKLLQAAK